MSNKLYDILKWVAILFLPALSTLVVTVCTIWGFPYGNEIGNTITAVGLFLGAILGLSHIQYKKGE